MEDLSKDIENKLELQKKDKLRKLKRKQKKQLEELKELEKLKSKLKEDFKNKEKKIDPEKKEGIISSIMKFFKNFVIITLLYTLFSLPTVRSILGSFLFFFKNTEGGPSIIYILLRGLVFAFVYSIIRLLI